MKTAPDHATRIAWFSAMAATALGAVGMVFELVGGRHLPGMPDWPAYVSIAVSATLFAALVGFRARAHVKTASVVFVVNAAAISFALLMRDPHYAAFGNWMPFQANKLACVIAALLAPQMWSALAGIAMHSTSALLVLATAPPALRERIAFEPFGTLVFAFVGVVLVLYRQRRLALEREVATIRTEALAAERLARVSLAVRDLANTPIQTIELCTAVLRQRAVDGDAEVLARLDRAVASLRMLSEQLKPYEANISWRAEDTAIDSVSELKAPW